MKIFLTGGTGYVGSAMISHLLNKGHLLSCLTRKNSPKINVPAQFESKISWIEGDLHDKNALKRGMEGADAVIHLVGIIRENPKKDVTFQRIHIDGTQNTLEEAVKYNIKRFVHMSALGARSDTTSNYHKSKYNGEQLVKQSGLPYTIFQPSVIFGPNDEFVNMLAQLVRLPVTPVIGDGEYQLQPVALETVCQVFEQALSTPLHKFHTYEVGGPDIFSYNQMLDTIGEVLGKKVTKLHQPLWLMKPLIRVMERFPFFPITSNQLTMLLEGNVCQEGKRLYQDFEITPVSFKQGISTFLK